MGKELEIEWKEGGIELDNVKAGSLFKAVVLSAAVGAVGGCVIGFKVGLGINPADYQTRKKGERAAEILGGVTVGLIAVGYMWSVFRR